MYGTVEYFTENMKTIVMNRLIEEEAVSLTEYYSSLQEEIKGMDQQEALKNNCLNNLNKAYGKVMDQIYGEEEEL